MLSIFNLPDQLPGEEVIRVYHRSFFIILKKLFLVCLLIILPTLLLAIIKNSFSFFSDNIVGYALVVTAISVYYLFAWVFAFFIFIDYYFDVWIVTNQRIIDIEQRGFFSRVISEQKLFRVQDVTSEMQGFWQTIMKYGEVHIQTAGEKERFVFQEVSNPDMVRETIIKLAEISKKKINENQNS